MSNTDIPSLEDVANTNCHKNQVKPCLGKTSNYTINCVTFLVNSSNTALVCSGYFGLLTKFFWDIRSNWNGSSPIKSFALQISSPICAHSGSTGYSVFKSHIILPIPSHNFAFPSMWQFCLAHVRIHTSGNWSSFPLSTPLLCKESLATFLLLTQMLLSWAKTTCI